VLDEKRLENESHFEKQIMIKILRIAAYWDKYYYGPHDLKK
jgi:hypothetical protein